MNQEVISKVMAIGNPRVKLLLLLLKQEMPLDTVVGLKVTDLGELKGIDGDLGIVRDYLNTLGTEGIKRGILFPHKNKQDNISRMNARQSIEAACKKAGVKLEDLELGLTWSGSKTQPVIPEVKTMEELMKEIKTIQGGTTDKPKATKTA